MAFEFIMALMASTRHPKSAAEWLQSGKSMHPDVLVAWSTVAALVLIVQNLNEVGLATQLKLTKAEA